MMYQVPDTRNALYILPLWIIILAIGYMNLKRKNKYKNRNININRNKEYRIYLYSFYLNSNFKLTPTS